MRPPSRDRPALLLSDDMTARPGLRMTGGNDATHRYGHADPERADPGRDCRRIGIGADLTPETGLAPQPADGPRTREAGDPGRPACRWLASAQRRDHARTGSVGGHG